MIRGVARSFSQNARRKRAALFRKTFDIGPNTRVLDLGGGSGAHIHMVIGDLGRVTVADVIPEDLEKAKSRGYDTVLLRDEIGPLPFADSDFDVVFCSSVIEHVCVPYREVWSDRYNSKSFTEAAVKSQQDFAREIARVGRGYFVQTPYRYFPIESHSWMPMPWLFMPRRAQIAFLSWTNKFWPKQTGPDFHLLTGRDMRRLFPGAHLVRERVAGLCKSLIAVRGVNAATGKFAGGDG